MNEDTKIKELRDFIVSNENVFDRLEKLFPAIGVIADSIVDTMGNVIIRGRAPVTVSQAIYNLLIPPYGEMYYTAIYKHHTLIPVNLPDTFKISFEIYKVGDVPSLLVFLHSNDEAPLLGAEYFFKPVRTSGKLTYDPKSYGDGIRNLLSNGFTPSLSLATTAHPLFKTDYGVGTESERFIGLTGFLYFLYDLFKLVKDGYTYTVDKYTKEGISTEGGRELDRILSSYGDTAIGILDTLVNKLLPFL